MKMENLMIVNSQTGEKEEILGKIMYYSLPKLMVKVDKVKEICERIGFPIGVNDNPSLTDAFKTATSSIYRRIIDVNGSGNTSPRILDRWKIKIQMLLAKKQEYERILKQDLSGVDESFTLLEDTCDQFDMQVKRTQVFGIAA